MTGFYVLLLVVAAVLGNFIIRRIIAKIDAVPDVTQPMVLQVDAADVNLDNILNDFGIREGGEIPIQHLPLNPDFVRIAKEYEKIVFDGCPVFDRTLMEAPYHDNPEYVQIGLHDTQDPVLLKRHSEVSAIYIINIDEGSSTIPEECVSSFETYIKMEYNLYIEVLKAKCK